MESNPIKERKARPPKRRRNWESTREHEILTIICQLQPKFLFFHNWFYHKKLKIKEIDIWSHSHVHVALEWTNFLMTLRGLSKMWSSVLKIQTWTRDQTRPSFGCQNAGTVKPPQGPSSCFLAFFKIPKSWRAEPSLSWSVWSIKLLKRITIQWPIHDIKNSFVFCFWVFKLDLLICHFEPMGFWYREGLYVSL